MSSGFDEEFHAATKAAKEQSRQHALKAALGISVTAIPESSQKTPLVFGAKWAAKVARIRESMSDVYGSQLGDLMRYSHRHYVYACEDAAEFMRLLFDRAGGARNEEERKLITAHGYADNEGKAYTLYNSLAEISKPNELLLNSGFADFPRGEDCLNAIGICWFFDAAASHKKNPAEAHDLLFEAAEAFDLSNGLWMWEEGEKNACGEPPASAMAKRRHAETYAIRDAVISHWRTNIDQKLSKQKAAEKLVGFAPVNYRTIYGWLLAADK